MLVTAIMDIVTSSCDSIDRTSFQPTLPGNANTGDIAAALQVIEEGGMHLDEPRENDDEDGDKGLRGIGIKILGGTTVLGFSRIDGIVTLEHLGAANQESARHVPENLLLHKNPVSSPYPSLPKTQLLIPSDLFIVSIVSSFPKCHLVELLLTMSSFT